MLPEPHPVVAVRLAAEDASNVFLSVISEAELRYGVAILPPGARRNRLATELVLGKDFQGRVLPFDRDAARAYAMIGAARRAAGRPISQADCQIAAIARSCRAGVAARSDADFAHIGIDVINS